MLAILALIALVIYDATRSGSDDTANTIIAAHRACEAQTGHRCD